MEEQAQTVAIRKIVSAVYVETASAETENLNGQTSSLSSRQ